MKFKLPTMLQVYNMSNLDKDTFKKFESTWQDLRKVYNLGKNIYMFDRVKHKKLTR